MDSVVYHDHRNRLQGEWPSRTTPSRAGRSPRLTDPSLPFIHSTPLARSLSLRCVPVYQIRTIELDGKRIKLQIVSGLSVCRVPALSSGARPRGDGLAAGITAPSSVVHRRRRVGGNMDVKISEVCRFADIVLTVSRVCLLPGLQWDTAGTSASAPPLSFDLLSFHFSALPAPRPPLSDYMISPAIICFCGRASS